MTDLTNCDGSNPTIISALSCSIPTIVLNASPYNLPWGTDVYAKVLASNIYGSSPLSVSGHGGIMVRIPDSPINLSENTSLRNATTLAIIWNDGSNNGGLPIIDYRILIA